MAFGTLKASIAASAQLPDENATKMPSNPLNAHYKALREIPPEIVALLDEMVTFFVRLGTRIDGPLATVLVAEAIKRRGYEVTTKMGLQILNGTHATFHSWNEMFGKVIDTSIRFADKNGRPVDVQLIDGFDLPEGVVRTDTQSSLGQQIVDINIDYIIIYELKGAEALWRTVGFSSTVYTPPITAGHPDPAYIFSRLIQAYVTQKVCMCCGKPSKSVCGNCKLEGYCGRECQKQRWTIHKVHCKKPPQE